MEQRLPAFQPVEHQAHQHQDLDQRQRQAWQSGFKVSWGDVMNTPAFSAFRLRRLVLHGLRKSAVNALLEAGCTEAEVSAITGQSPEMIKHYSRMVNRRKLARSAMTKLEAENGS